MADFKQNIDDEIDNESLGVASDEEDEQEDDLINGIATVKNANKTKKAIKIKTDDDEEDDEDEDDEEDDEDDYDDDDEEPIEDETNQIVGNNINNIDDDLSINFDDFENDSDDDDDDENYLQKFEDMNKSNLLNMHHPELVCHNNDEIDALSTVQRDKNNNIIDPLHKTVPFITKYEIARVIGERAKQIESGSNIFTEVDENTIDSYLIALKEFNEKKIPFIIKRPMPNGSCEYWKLQDLEILV
tara:strand:+ start:18287 stop:19018 length:732 start_codon:yes stop_codon:yes gene_type:complete